MNNKCINNKREALNELVTLGYHYKAINAFVEHEGMAYKHEREEMSTYRRALAAGITGIHSFIHSFI